MARRRADQDGAPEISPQTGRPEWAGRVSRYKIAKLYHTDALGIVDKDQIDAVGYALLARWRRRPFEFQRRKGRGREVTWDGLRTSTLR